MRFFFSLIMSNLFFFARPRRFGEKKSDEKHRKKHMALPRRRVDPTRRRVLSLSSARTSKCM